jgi:hypothetical protein
MGGPYDADDGAWFTETQATEVHAGGIDLNCGQRGDGVLRAFRAVIEPVRAIEVAVCLQRFDQAPGQRKWTYPKPPGRQPIPGEARARIMQLAPQDPRWDYRGTRHRLRHVVRLLAARGPPDSARHLPGHKHVIDVNGALEATGRLTSSDAALCAVMPVCGPWGIDTGSCWMTYLIEVEGPMTDLDGLRAEILSEFGEQIVVSEFREAEDDVLSPGKLGDSPMASFIIQLASDLSAAAAITTAGAIKSRISNRNKAISVKEKQADDDDKDE